MQTSSRLAVEEFGRNALAGRDMQQRVDAPSLRSQRSYQRSQGSPALSQSDASNISSSETDESEEEASLHSAAQVFRSERSSRQNSVDSSTTGLSDSIINESPSYSATSSLSSSLSSSGYGASFRDQLGPKVTILSPAPWGMSTSVSTQTIHAPPRTSSRVRRSSVSTNARPSLVSRKSDEGKGLGIGMMPAAPPLPKSRLAASTPRSRPAPLDLPATQRYVEPASTSPQLPFSAPAQLCTFSEVGITATSPHKKTAKSSNPFPLPNFPPPPTPSSPTALRLGSAPSSPSLYAPLPHRDVPSPSASPKITFSQSNPSGLNPNVSSPVYTLVSLEEASAAQKALHRRDDAIEPERPILISNVVKKKKSGFIKRLIMGVAGNSEKEFTATPYPSPPVPFLSESTRKFSATTTSSGGSSSPPPTLLVNGDAARPQPARTASDSPLMYPSTSPPSESDHLSPTIRQFDSLPAPPSLRPISMGFGGMSSSNSFIRTPISATLRSPPLGSSTSAREVVKKENRPIVERDAAPRATSPAASKPKREDLERQVSQLKEELARIQTVRLPSPFRTLLIQSYQSGCESCGHVKRYIETLEEVLEEQSPAVELIGLDRGRFPGSRGGGARFGN